MENPPVGEPPRDGEHPPPTANVRAVRILLECILVHYNITRFLHFLATSNRETAHNQISSNIENLVQHFILVQHLKCAVRHQEYQPFLSVPGLLKVTKWFKRIHDILIFRSKKMLICYLTD